MSNVFDEPSERARFFARLSPEELKRAKAAEPGGGGGPNSKYSIARTSKLHVQGTNLFGEDFRPDSDSVLKQRFEFVPFSIFNQRDGAWQARKSAWISLGIQSEVGRGANLLKMSDTVLEPDPEKRAAMQARRGYAEAFDSGSPGTLSAQYKEKEKTRNFVDGALLFQSDSGNDPDYYRKKQEVEAQLGRELTTAEFQRDYYEGPDTYVTGTSIFDPVLCELLYKWFCPPGGLVLDPFAGGSVRGIIAGLLGFRYYGIELRPEQVEANTEQKQRIAPDADVQWVCGDSNKQLLNAPEADFILSCPPYFDLEVYSDEPDDLSNMTWDQFVGLYRAIIRKAVARLKPNRFACFVVSEIRDKKTGLCRGFVPLTAASFMTAGADLYNEAVLVNPTGSLAIRIDKQFRVSRKLGRTHQNVLVHVKGDPRAAAAACVGEPTAVGPDLPLAGPPVPDLPRLPALPALSLRPETPAPAAPSMEAPLLDLPFSPAPAPTVALPRVEVTEPARPRSLADFLGTAPQRTQWVAREPLPLSGIHDIVLNFETNGLEWAQGHRPVGVTVGTLDGKEQRYLPFAHQGGGNLDEGKVREYIRNEVRGKRITNHNTRFDVHMGREWGIDLEAQGNTVSDVAHWAALLDDHRRRFALDELAKDYLGAVDVMRINERNMAIYAASDVADRAEYQAKVVAQLRDKMWPELDAQDLQKVRQLEDEVIYPVVEMEKNGAQLDLELLDEMGRQCTAVHEQLMAEITHEAGFQFEHTTSSWKRLFERCGLMPQESYAEDVVTLHDHPLIVKAHRASQFASLNSKTFAAYRKNVTADGLLRFDINQLRGDEGGTVSGRFSIGYVQQVPNHDNHHEVFGEGLNEECQPGQCHLFPRRVFIPKSGMFLAADAAQIEYRIFAHFAGNKKVLDAYLADPDMSFHKYTWAKFKEHKPDMKYSWQKSMNFMVMYAGGLAKLALMMGFITKQEFAAIQTEENNPAKWDNPKLTEAKKIKQIYDTIMPEVGPLIARASHLAKSSCDNDCKRGGRFRDLIEKFHREYPHRGYVRTLEGRRSRFPNNWKTYRGLNRVIQGTAADIMKHKLVDLHRCRKETGLLMRLTIHDEIAGDAPDVQCEAKVREILNQQTYVDIKVPIRWACSTGANWAEAK